MKYSDTLMSWKTTSKLKSRNNINTTTPEQIEKTSKSNYINSAISSPDFDQCFSDFYNVISTKGTDKDKTIIITLSKKLKKGDIEFDDISTIETIYNNNYKHLFSIPPEECSNSTITTTVLGVLLILGAIIVRISYAFEENTSLIIFIAVINFLASAYTFLSWPTQVTNSVKQWLDLNCVPTFFENRIMKRVKKVIWFISILLLIILAIILISSYYLSIQKIISDCVSIVILGISILNEKIVNIIEKAFENHIYRNGKK